MGVSENWGYLILGVLIIRILLFRVLYLGSPIFGNSHCGVTYNNYVAGTKWVHLEALAWVFSATSAFRVGLRKPVVCTL